MKKINNCQRCGKELTIKKVKEVNFPKCNHCNMIHELDKRSKVLRNVIMGIVLFSGAILAFIVQITFNLDFMYVMPVVVVLGLFGNWMATFIGLKFRSFSYQEYHQ